ncbi:MAG: hypothetical protein KDK12_20590, partial [Rhodobacteraceae bacterium]|nr:hypothetical protein [Paracoccaceae bacterium]
DIHRLRLKPALAHRLVHARHPVTNHPRLARTPFAGHQVNGFDLSRKGHRETDVAARYVETESVGDQRETDGRGKALPQTPDPPGAQAFIPRRFAYQAESTQQTPAQPFR